MRVCIYAVIDDKPKESIPEHDAQISSIRWHLSEGAGSFVDILFQIFCLRKVCVDPHYFWDKLKSSMYFSDLLPN